MRTLRRVAAKFESKAVAVVDEYEAAVRKGLDLAGRLGRLAEDVKEGFGLSASCGDDRSEISEEEEPLPNSPHKGEGLTLGAAGAPGTGIDAAGERAPLTKRDQLSTSSQADLLSSPAEGEVAVPHVAASDCGEAVPQVDLSPCGSGYEGRASIANSWPQSVRGEDFGQAYDARLWRLAIDDWQINGRDEQKPPPGDWRTWLILGGRGSGKTRAGAEWVQAVASDAATPLRIALVAETLADAREVMVDGVSGLWRIAGRKRPAFEISRRRLVWPNGSVAQLFSSEDPESLRGPQFDLAWCDELGKWKHAQETWDMLQFGLRLGTEPRQVVTTTPRAMPLLKAIIADPGTLATRLSTAGNAGNLAPGFIKAMRARYGGTRLGRQELDGELIEDREDALWSRAMLERLRQRNPGRLGRIVVAVDPPAAERAKNSCCGIVVAGLEASGRAAVLADLSVANASPGTWGAAVVRAARRFQADRVVAEINQGGDMVSAILRSIDPALPVTTVRATRGKFLRAEPVAALYEQGRVVHAGTFADLEDQMCDFGPEGLSGGGSPDRLDALVWALTSLMLSGQGEPRVRGM